MQPHVNLTTVPSRRRPAGRWRWVGALPAIALLVAGCAGDRKEQATPRSSYSEAAAKGQLTGTVLDPVRFRNHLIMFADRFNAEIAGTGTAIAERATDPVVREQSIQWRLRFIPLVYIAVRNADPRAAYLEIWTGCVRMEHFFEDGAGKSWFGDQQQLAIDCSKRLVADIVALGKQFYPDALIDKADPEVESFALTLSDERRGIPQISTSSKARKAGSGLASLLSIPIAPVKGLQGVGDTPGSIVYAAETAQQLGQLVQSMPEQARWQLELLALELQSIETVQDFRRDLHQTSESVASLAETAKALPQDLRQQLTSTLDDASTTIKELDTALTTAAKVATSIDETSRTMHETAVALQATAETVESIVGPSSPDSTSASGKESSSGDDTIGDLLKTSEQLHATATELRGLVGDLESERLETVFGQLGRTSETTIDYAVRRGTVAGLLLVGALVASQVLYRILVTKVIGSGRR